MFVKVESERLFELRHNQSKLRANEYNHLCELRADSATNKDAVNEWRGNNEKNSALNVGRLVVFRQLILEVIDM